MEIFKQRTCLSCGWVHFSRTREFAEAEVAAFNKFYDAAPPETQEMYGGRSKIENYERCSLCGGSYTNFRDSVKGDCPDGCTLSPIITDLIIT